MNEIDLLARHDPAPVLSGTEGAQVLRMALPELASSRGRRGLRLGRRGVTVAAIGAAALAAGGVAFAVAGQAPATALRVNCAGGASRAVVATGAWTNVLASTADGPVAACAAAWNSLASTPAPELTAYDTGGEWIAVAPAGWQVPPAWRPLVPAFRTDPARLELNKQLWDHMSSTANPCLSTAEATIQARQILDGLGLSGWTIRIPPGVPMDGRTLCAKAQEDNSGTTVVHLYPSDPAATTSRP
jgi:hypothetical protein